MKFVVTQKYWGHSDLWRAYEPDVDQVTLVDSLEETKVLFFRLIQNFVTSSEEMPLSEAGYQPIVDFLADCEDILEPEVCASLKRLEALVQGVLTGADSLEAYNDLRLKEVDDLGWSYAFEADDGHVTVIHGDDELHFYVHPMINAQETYYFQYKHYDWNHNITSGISLMCQSV